MGGQTLRTTTYRAFDKQLGIEFAAHSRLALSHLMNDPKYVARRRKMRAEANLDFLIRHSEVIMGKAEAKRQRKQAKRLATTHPPIPTNQG